MDSPRRSLRTTSRQHPYETNTTRAERQMRRQKKQEAVPPLSKRLWRFINPFAQDSTDDDSDSDEEGSNVEGQAEEEEAANATKDSEDQETPNALETTDSDDGDAVLENENGKSDSTDTPIEVDEMSLRAASPLPDSAAEPLSQTESQPDNSQATLIASLQTDDSAIVADESEEFAGKKSLESDRSSQVDVVEAGAGDVSLSSAQVQDQTTKGGSGGKRSKRLRGKRAESPALTAAAASAQGDHSSAAGAGAAQPLSTRITRRSTRSQGLKLDEPHDEAGSRQTTPVPAVEAQVEAEKPREGSQEPKQDASTTAAAVTVEEQETVSGVLSSSSSLIEVVVETKKSRSSKKSKGKKGRKKSVVDKRAAEPELSDDDKEQEEEAAEPEPEPEHAAAVVTISNYTMDVDEEEDEERASKFIEKEEGAAKVIEKQEEEVTDRFYAAHLRDLEAREELEKEEFYTSTQFEDQPETFEDEDTIKYYPPVPEGQDEEENEETVKYYPPSEVEEELDPKAIYGLPDTDVDTAATTTPISYGYGSDAEEDLCATSAAESAPTFYAGEASEAFGFEFSPMQTPTASPAPTPGPSRLRMMMERGGGDESEEAEATPRAGSPKQQGGTDDGEPSLEALSSISLHPSHNLDVLIAFFRQRRGNMLTREQADICQRLIEDCTQQDGQGRRFWRDQKKTTVRDTEERQDQPMSAEDQPDNDDVATATRRGRAEPPQPTATVPQLQRMVMKRVAPQEEEEEDDDQGGRSRAKRVVVVAPSLDEYLEIEKYKGVAWDELPDYVKIRRQLEWKGTEPPEVVRQREVERQRKRQMEAVAAAAAAAKQRQQKAQEEAERVARETEEAKEAAGKRLVRKHGRTATAESLLVDEKGQGVESDEEEEEEDGRQTRKRKQLLDGDREDKEDRQKSGMSSVAQMMLQVVGKTAEVGGKAKQKMAGSQSVGVGGSQTSTTVKVDAMGSSPFSFAPVEADKTNSQDEEEEEEDQVVVVEEDEEEEQAEQVEKSAPLSLDAIRKEAAEAAKKPTASSIFAVPATGSLFAKPAAPSDMGSDAGVSAKDKALSFSVAETPAAAPLFGFKSTGTFGATTEPKAGGSAGDATSGKTATTSIPFGSLQSSSPFGSKITPSFGFGSQGSTTTTTTTTTSSTSGFAASSGGGLFGGQLGSSTAPALSSKPFVGFGVATKTQEEGASKVATTTTTTATTSGTSLFSTTTTTASAPGFGLFQQPAAGSRPAKTLWSSQPGGEDEEGEGTGGSEIYEDENENDEEGGQGYHHTDEDYYSEGNDGQYSGGGGDDGDSGQRSRSESPLQDKENVAPVQPIFSVPGPFNFGVTGSATATKPAVDAGGGGGNGSAFSAFSSSSSSSMTTSATKGFSFGATTASSTWTKTMSSSSSSGSPAAVTEFDFSFEGEEEAEEAQADEHGMAAGVKAKVPMPSRLVKHRSSISEYERSPERFVEGSQDVEEGVMSPMISPLASPTLSPTGAAQFGLGTANKSF